MSLGMAPREIVLPDCDFSMMIVQAFLSKEPPLRFQDKSRLGFYPLPLSEAQRIRRLLWYPNAPSSAIDPCVGDGVAFEVITSGGEIGIGGAVTRSPLPHHLSITHNSGRCHYPFLKMAMLVAMIFCIRDLARA